MLSSVYVVIVNRPTCCIRIYIADIIGEIDKRLPTCLDISPQVLLVRRSLTNIVY